MSSKIIDSILHTEYSEEFDKLRKGIVVQSYFKYGSANINYKDGNVDAIGSVEKCLAKFKETHNTEYLLDVANYCMFRFMYPQKGEFYKPTTSEESAGLSGISIKEIEAIKEESMWG